MVGVKSSFVLIFIVLHLDLCLLLLSHVIIYIYKNKNRVGQVSSLCANLDKFHLQRIVTNSFLRVRIKKIQIVIYFIFN